MVFGGLLGPDGTLTITGNNTRVIFDFFPQVIICSWFFSSHVGLHKREDTSIPDDWLTQSSAWPPQQRGTWRLWNAPDLLVRSSTEHGGFEEANVRSIVYTFFIFFFDYLCYHFPAVGVSQGQTVAECVTDLNSSRQQCPLRWLRGCVGMIRLAASL